MLVRGWNADFRNSSEQRGDSNHRLATLARCIVAAFARGRRSYTTLPRFARVLGERGYDCIALSCSTRARQSEAWCRRIERVAGSFAVWQRPSLVSIEKRKPRWSTEDHAGRHTTNGWHDFTHSLCTQDQHGETIHAIEPYSAKLCSTGACETGMSSHCRSVHGMQSPQRCGVWR